MDILYVILFVAFGAIIFGALVKALKWKIQPMVAAVLGAAIVIGGLAYYGEIDLESTPVVAAIDGVAVEFDVELSVNDTANTLDNTSEDDNSFMTPFGRNTTAHSMRTTDSTQAAGGAGFVDPVYNITVTPIPTSGVTNDDLVTIKFSAADPGETISDGGTDYRLIAQDGDGDAYLYFSVRKTSDDSLVGASVQKGSGSATFLYTESVYIQLMVVYQDTGCSRMTDFTTETFSVTLSNVDGTWSQTIPISVMPIVNHA